MVDREHIEDQELLLRIQAGSHAAFAILVKRHADRFYKLAFRFVNSREVAEDLVQDAFLALWERPARWSADKSTKFTSWFYRIVINRCLNYRKQVEHFAAIDEEGLTDDRLSQDEVLMMSEKQQALEVSIAALPDRQRTALNLCFYEGVSNQMAAEIMGVKLKALQSLLMRAKNNLKERLTKYL